ncbi:DnaJ-domain-containing protein, partial [Mycena olivaceomarginata]
MDLYAVLDLAPRRPTTSALLAAHPDKNNTSQPTPDIAAIKDAYRILSSPALRAKAMAKADHDQLKRPRPGEVISLADFDEHGADAWTHACRCGSAYAITGAEMDRGVHLVPSFGWAMSWQRRS